MSWKTPQEFTAAVRSVFGSDVHATGEASEAPVRKAPKALASAGPAPYLDDCTHVPYDIGSEPATPPVVPTSEGDSVPWGGPYTEVDCRVLRDGSVDVTIVERSGGFAPHKAKGVRKEFNAAKVRDDMDPETLARSVGRAKRVLRTTCCQLNVDRMFTFTFRDEVRDIDAWWTVFGDFLDLYRSGLPYSFYMGHQKHTVDRLEYVLVPERQKRGVWHGHMATNSAHDINRMRDCWQEAQRMAGLVNADGNVNVRRRSDRSYRSTNARRCAGYLAKYLGKEFHDGEMYRKRYSRSKGIPEPEVRRFYFMDMLSTDELLEFVCGVTNTRWDGRVFAWKCAGQDAVSATLLPP